jgi:hypothetical protein
VASSGGRLTLTGPDASIHHNSAGTAGRGIYAPSATRLINCTDGGNVYGNTPQNIFLVTS